MDKWKSRALLCRQNLYQGCMYPNSHTRLSTKQGHGPWGTNGLLFYNATCDSAPGGIPGHSCLHLEVIMQRVSLVGNSSYSGQLDL